MSGGKYYNVGLSDTGRLSATQRQLHALRRMTNRDHSGKGLTRDAASDLIEALKQKRAENRQELGATAIKLYAALMKRAVELANETGARWLQKHSAPQFVVNDTKNSTKTNVHGAIGEAWLTWPKRNSEIYKWMQQHNYHGDTKRLVISHQYLDRPEVELQIACLIAAMSVFRESGRDLAGITLRFKAEEPLDVQIG